MANTRWLVGNKKVFLVAAVVIVLVFTAFRVADGIRLRAMTNPVETFQTALFNTLGAQSFSFQVQVKIGNRLISDIQGQKAAPDGIHITGTMQNTPVEFIHTEGRAYIKGYWSDNWSVLPDNSLVDSELFITELNPLGMFTFRDIPQIKALKPEKIDGKNMVVLELRPIVENPLMELNYNDFVYLVWVDPGAQLIRKAHITASGISGSRDKLEVDIELKDYNRQVVISPPAIY